MMLSDIVFATILTLAQTNPEIEISFNEGFIDNDVAQAQRFMGSSYAETTACVVTFDRSNFERIGEIDKYRYIKIDRSKLRDFIMLHEIAHCLDGIPAPKGVDAIEWREFLADVYSASELYSAGVIDKRDFEQLIKLRKNHPDPFKTNALGISKEFIEADHVNSSQRIAAAKLFREAIFASRMIDKEISKTK